MNSKRFEEAVIGYFTSRLQQWEKAKNQLSEAALTVYDAERAAEIRKACGEDKYDEFKENISVLASLFEEGRRAEQELKESYETYRATASAATDVQSTKSCSYDEVSSSVQEETSSQLSLSGPADKAKNAGVDDGKGKTSGAQRGFQNSQDIMLLSNEEFASVPGYMKGRCTVSQVNAIINKLNTVLEKKYRILQGGFKMARSNEMKDAFYKYRDQENANESGARFCAETDLRETLTDAEAVFLKKAITILRHCKRIKDTRFKKETFLAALP